VATGGAVPGFDVTAIAPSRPVFLRSAVAIDAGVGAIATRGQALSLEWTPATHGQVHFALQTNDGNLGAGRSFETLDCWAPAAQGQLTIPAAAIDVLQVRGDGGLATLSTETWAESFVTAGQWEVRLLLQGTMTDDAGTHAFGLKVQ
jgi:hypothetical protein